MKQEHAQFIVKILKNADVVASVYENYSGRGMYGDTTFGVDTELHPMQWTPVIIRWVNDMVEPVDDKCNEWHGGEVPEIGAFNIDNLGLGYIVY